MKSLLAFSLFSLLAALPVAAQQCAELNDENVTKSVNVTKDANGYQWSGIPMNGDDLKEFCDSRKTLAVIRGLKGKHLTAAEFSKLKYSSLYLTQDEYDKEVVPESNYVITHKFEKVVPPTRNT